MSEISITLKISFYKYFIKHKLMWALFRLKNIEISARENMPMENSCYLLLVIFKSGMPNYQETFFLPDKQLV